MASRPPHGGDAGIRDREGLGEPPVLVLSLVHTCTKHLLDAKHWGPRQGGGPCSPEVSEGGVSEPWGPAPFL